MAFKKHAGSEWKENLVQSVWQTHEQIITDCQKDNLLN